MACQVVFENGEITKVYSPNGQESNLYNQILSHYQGNKEKALEKWVQLTSQKDSLRLEQLDSNGEPIVTDDLYLAEDISPIINFYKNEGDKSYSDSKAVFNRVLSRLKAEYPLLANRIRGRKVMSGGGYVYKFGLDNPNLMYQLNTPIKEGVEELFESNPELANAVYEALGVNKKLDFYKGDILTIDEKTYSIVEKISSKELAKRNGLTISSNIPVYIVKESLGARKGGYDTVNNIIILSENSDKETIHHELIHSVEYNLDKSELNHLYEKVKDSITEDSFDGFVSWNFKKSISEFVADALSKKVFRDALKKEGLLEEVDNALSVYTFEITPQQKQQAIQLYSQYLDTIFPDSKVKDIVYRADKRIGLTSQTTVDDFTQIYINGVYYSTEIEYVKNYNKVLNGKIYPTVLNITNPGEIKTKQDIERLGRNKEEFEKINKLKYSTNPKDSLIFDNTKYKTKDKYGEVGKEIVVFEPEQIHILSSKADIQGFKDFMSFENSEFSKYGTYQQFTEFITSKSSIEIENKLIETGKIDRVC